MKRFKLLDIITTKYSQGMRIIKGERFNSDNHRAIQYHGGGDDFCPSEKTDGLCMPINENGANTVICLYKDEITRLSQQGEKRIYSSDVEGGSLKAQIHLKNDGKIYIQAMDDLDIEVAGNCNITVIGNTTLTTPLFTINGNTLFNGNVSYGTVGESGTPEIDGTATMKSSAVLNNQGTINNTGTISGAGTISSNGKVLATHVHSGVQSGINNTGAPV